MDSCPEAEERINSRIKIWDKFTGLLVYDNQLGGKDDADPTTAIAGGSIIITKP